MFKTSEPCWPRRPNTHDTDNVKVWTIKVQLYFEPAPQTNYPLLPLTAPSFATYRASSKWCKRKMDTHWPTPSAVPTSSHLTKNNTLHASSDLLFETVKRALSMEGSFFVALHATLRKTTRNLCRSGCTPASQQDSRDRIQPPRVQQEGRMDGWLTERA